MEYVASALAVLAALTFVAYPLVRGNRPERTASDQALTLAEQRAEIYRELLELEFDRRVGKLNEADFRQLSDACVARASELVDAEEVLTESIERRIEREVALARRSHQPSTAGPPTAGPSTAEEMAAR